jgi:hypothetical protein
MYGKALSARYYEEVGIIPERSLAQLRTIMGVRPGLCGTSENSVKAKFNFAECSFHALR